MVDNEQPTPIFVTMRGVTEAQIIQAKLTSNLPIKSWHFKEDMVLIVLEGPTRWLYETEDQGHQLYCDYKGIEPNAWNALFDLVGVQVEDLCDLPLPGLTGYKPHQAIGWAAYNPWGWGSESYGDWEMFRAFGLKKVTSISFEAAPDQEPVQIVEHS